MSVLQDTVHVRTELPVTTSRDPTAVSVLMAGLDRTVRVTSTTANPAPASTVGPALTVLDSTSANALLEKLVS